MRDPEWDAFRDFEKGHDEDAEGLHIRKVSYNHLPLVMLYLSACLFAWMPFMLAMPAAIFISISISMSMTLASAGDSRLHVRRRCCLSLGYGAGANHEIFSDTTLATLINI